MADILIVEDDKELADLLTGFLREEGYVVSTDKRLFGQSSIIIPFPIHNALFCMFNQFLQPALK